MTPPPRPARGSKAWRRSRWTSYRAARAGAAVEEHGGEVRVPEFAGGGKEGVTVAQCMSHTAGLPAVDVPLTVDELCAVEPVLRALEAQEPLWEPGTANGYHAITYGWIVGEIVRRIDGRTLGTFLAEEVAGPLGAESYIGLPESEEHRVAPIINSPPPTDPEVLELMRAIIGPVTMGYRSLTMDGAIELDKDHFCLEARSPDGKITRWPVFLDVEY